MPVKVSGPWQIAIIATIGIYSLGFLDSRFALPVVLHKLIDALSFSYAGLGILSGRAVRLVLGEAAGGDALLASVTWTVVVSVQISECAWMLCLLRRRQLFGRLMICLVYAGVNLMAIRIAWGI